MSRLDPATWEFLAEVVLNESTDRVDRLFSLRLLVEELTASQDPFGRADPRPRALLGRIAAECKDPFIRKLALLSVRRTQLAAEVALRAATHP